MDEDWRGRQRGTHDTTHRWAIRPSLSVVVVIRDSKLTCVLTSDDSLVDERKGEKLDGSVEVSRGVVRQTSSDERGC